MCDEELERKVAYYLRKLESLEHRLNPPHLRCAMIKWRYDRKSVEEFIKLYDKYYQATLQDFDEGWKKEVEQYEKNNM